ALLMAGTRCLNPSLRGYSGPAALHLQRGEHEVECVKTMAIPADINARRYYRVAYQRLDDGQALLEINRPRAAIYLTGYAVECMMKALLLTSTPAAGRPQVLATFHGAIAQSIECSGINSYGASARCLSFRHGTFPWWRV